MAFVNLELVGVVMFDSAVAELVAELLKPPELRWLLYCWASSSRGPLPPQKPYAMIAVFAVHVLPRNAVINREE